MKIRVFLLSALAFSVILILIIALHGCHQDAISTTQLESNNLSTDSAIPPRQAQIPGAVENPNDSGMGVLLQIGDGSQPNLASFSPPSIHPATPIPPPLEGLELDEDILIWVLLGSDTEPPFLGRTQAIHLLFINTRFSKASLISIPGNLYVYIPGHTMQRINTAYAIGGIELLRTTLEYNFGVNPSRFVLAHPGDFHWLVDDLNSVDVTVFYPIPHACGGIRAGLVQMDGTLALCYVSYQDGIDEIDRMFRQQQLLRVIFNDFTRDGNLINLPVLFASYQGWVKTDFSLVELLGHIPLALRLADPDRVGYYMIGWDEITPWEVPGYSQAIVFLPHQDRIKNLFQTAIDRIMQPSPFTNQLQTLEAQLTAAYQGTATAHGIINPTPTPTPLQPINLTATPTATFLAPTILPPGYP